MSTEDELKETFNREIVRELIGGPGVSDEEVDEIWKLCHGNPWNAQVLHMLIGISQGETKE